MEYSMHTSHPPGGPPLFGFEWNQREDFPDELRDLIVSVAGLRPGTVQPVEVGTGFILQARGNRGIILTAAHVISDAVRAVQNPRRANRTALPEFLAPAVVSASTNALRVIVQNGSQVEVCRVASVMWDDKRDLAMLTVVTQEDDPESMPLQWRMKLTEQTPGAGELMLTAGFSEFAGLSTSQHPWSGQLSRKPVLRVGRVLAVHPQGTFLHRSPCVEATMPTFSGMSGGPAFLYRPGSEPLVFGMLSGSSGSSSDAKAHDPDAVDRTKASHSIFRLLPRTIRPLPDGSQMVELLFTLTEKAINEEISPDLFASDLSWVEQSHPN